MSLTIRVLTITTAVVVCLAVLVAHAQAPKPGPEQKSLEVPLQQRVAALEKEVQSLKTELAALRAQIQRSGSTQAPVNSAGGSRPNDARPSEPEIRACVAATHDPASGGELYGSYFGDVFQVEFGTTITSQGGIMDDGTPKDTKLFPIKVHFSKGPTVFEFRVFKDSFGTLKCINKGRSPLR